MKSIVIFEKRFFSRRVRRIVLDDERSIGPKVYGRIKTCKW